MNARTGRSKPVRPRTKKNPINQAAKAGKAKARARAGTPTARGPRRKADMAQAQKAKQPTIKRNTTASKPPTAAKSKLQRAGRSAAMRASGTSQAKAKYGGAGIARAVAGKGAGKTAGAKLGRSRAKSKPSMAQAQSTTRKRKPQARSRY